MNHVRAVEEILDYYVKAKGEGHPERRWSQPLSFHITNSFHFKAARSASISKKRVTLVTWMHVSP